MSHSLHLSLSLSRCLFDDVRSQAQYKRSQGKNPLSSSDERFTFKLQFHCHRFSKCVSHKHWCGVLGAASIAVLYVRAKRTVIQCAVNIWGICRHIAVENGAVRISCGTYCVAAAVAAAATNVTKITLRNKYAAQSICVEYVDDMHSLAAPFRVWVT